jgi:serine/threonine protein kinase
MPWLEEVFEKDRDSGIIELVRGLLEIDPRERLTATQALALPFLRDAVPAVVR